MAFMLISISDFKGRVHEEARRLNLAGFATNLTVSDPSVVHANAARANRPNIRCDYCGYRGHIKSECHKRIAEEYSAKQANRDQKGRGRGWERGHGRGRGRGRR